MKTTHTPDLLTEASLAEIASFQGRPCLSLYQPTHRRHPENQQDPIRFRHLVKALQTSLLQQHAVDAVKSLLEPAWQRPFVTEPAHVPIPHRRSP